MTQLGKLICAANRELDRSQVGEEAPSPQFLELLTETEESWVEAGQRFSNKEAART